MYLDAIEACQQQSPSPFSLEPAVPEARQQWSIWMRLGSVGMNTQQPAAAFRSFLTAWRLGAPGGDAFFAAGICAGQLGRTLRAATFYAAAARYGGPRAALATDPDA